SHQFVAEEAARQLGKPLSRLNLITCHLGGGWSAAAIRRGKPIDVSMGFTPLEGLVMMTRCGDIDAGAVFYLIKHLSVELGCQEAVKKVYELLNFQSGIKGLSEGTDSYLDLVREVSLGNEEAQSALALAFYRLSKYIAGYWLALGGRVDAIVLTGAIGAGDPFSRQELARRLRPLGKIKILRVKTQEELMIARQTRQILRLV
ncbi:acetate kinase, partial [Candidatus Parcubacteria bacterium]